MKPQERIAAIKMYNRGKENPQFFKEIGVSVAMIAGGTVACTAIPAALPIAGCAAAAVAAGKMIGSKNGPERKGG